MCSILKNILSNVKFPYHSDLLELSDITEEKVSKL